MRDRVTFPFHPKKLSPPHRGIWRVPCHRVVIKHINLKIMNKTSTVLKYMLAAGMLLISAVAWGQPLTQTIRGRLVDTDTKSPLLGATVVVLNSDPVLGTTTDMDGYYELPNVPVGKVDLLIRSLGYGEKVVPGVVVASGKQTQLNLEMEESFEQMDAVEITSGAHDRDALTEMSLTSVTAFSVEEARRSPGSFNDPARMASTFAGVQSDPEATTI